MRSLLQGEKILTHLRQTFIYIVFGCSFSSSQRVNSLSIIQTNHVVSYRDIKAVYF